MELLALKLALLLLLRQHLHFTSSTFTPNTTYFLDCGSSAAATFSDNPLRTFTPDTPYLTSSSSSSVLTVPSGSNALYNTARLFTKISTYQFKTTFPSTYVLRLHFHPFSSSSQNSDLSAARFAVSALNRFLLLSNFTLPPSTAAISPIIKEYILWADAGDFDVTFHPDPVAFISAIELFNAPDDLVSTSSPRNMDGIPSLGDLSRHALETVYRINAGGPAVTPANDTLWRTWNTDDGYLYAEDLSFVNATSQRVRYNLYGSELAPQIVYQTARSMAITPDMRASNPDFAFNVTWDFTVPSGYTYFIRLHFCDFISPTPGELYFDVYLGDQLAYPDLHPADFTASTPATAFYVDFAAGATGAELMRVSIGRSAKSVATTANAILNGLEIMKVNNSGGSLAGGSFNPEGENKGGRVSIGVIISSVIGGLVLIASVSAALVWIICRQRRRVDGELNRKGSTPGSWSPFTPFRYTSHSDTTSAGGTAATASSTPPRVGNLGLQIPFLEIKRATNDFDDELVIGSGGFGKVYKGILRDGTTVAVKRGMPGSRQGYPEFQTEIVLLSTIRHRHLVSLIGFCHEDSNMILVYEYMEKGTLRSHLHGSSSDVPLLTWKQRLQVCIGAARGLHYLHTGHSQSIIHRDVKSTNILLGEDYLAKVSDFGLSRLGPELEQTHVSTNVKGTIGYLDPEYFKTQKLTDKSDVYSLGVTLFEVLCGRPVIDASLERERINLAEWALKWQRRGMLEKIVDPRLGAGAINPNSLRKFGETAEKCLAEYGVDRPSIGDVLWNLEFALQLQETELRREAYEDSGNVEMIQVPVARRLPSMNIDDDDDDNNNEEGSNKQPEMSANNVFSQLITDEGR